MLFRKAVQQGRSERRGESYSVPYVEPLSDARTPLAAFVNSLLVSTPEFLHRSHFHAAEPGGGKLRGDTDSVVQVRDVDH